MNLGPWIRIIPNYHHVFFYESNLTLILLIFIFISCSSSEFLCRSLLCNPSSLECGCNEDRWLFCRLRHNVALLVCSVGCTEMTMWKDQQLRSLKPDTHERKIFLAALYFVITVEDCFFTMKKQTIPCEVGT